MKKVFNTSYVKVFLILLISLLMEEFIFRLIGDCSVLSISMLRILSEVIILSALFSFLINLINKSFVQKILMGLLIFAGGAYCSIQLGFNNFIGVYASLNASSQLGAVTDYIKDFMKSFEPVYFLPLLPFVLFIILSIVFRKVKLHRSSVLKTGLVSVCMELICVILYSVSILVPGLQNKLQLISNKDLFFTASNPAITVDQFGTFGFLFLDVKAYYFPTELKTELVVNNEPEEEEEVNEYTRVVDDQAWKIVNEIEDNATYKEISNYLLSQKITDKNDYTGMFKDKNLIVIMMESTNDIILQYPDLYPNMARMMENSWYFENNYSPRNSCATLNNEFSGMTSLYSIANTCTASTYKSNVYPEAIFNLYNNAGYTTFSSHDYTEAYYPRSKIHPNMGSGQYYGVQKLGISYSTEYRNWANDDDYFAELLKIIDKKREDGSKFMTWSTTVTGHQPYTSSSIQGDAYLNISRKINVPIDVKRYMSKMKIFDNALGVLVNGLEERGILEDTVIVMYGDHYPYGISTSHLNKALNYNTAEDMNAERVPFMIYNPSIEGQTFSQYTSYVNIIPTVANLFDLNYDPRHYVGYDLFDENYQSIVVFADGSWKNEKAYYKASKNSIKYYTSDEYTEEEIQNINKMVQDKISYSSRIVTSNYFYNLNSKVAAKQVELDALRDTTCLMSEKDAYLAAIEAAENAEEEEE